MFSTDTIPPRDVVALIVSPFPELSLVERYGDHPQRRRCADHSCQHFTKALPAFKPHSGHALVFQLMEKGLEATILFEPIEH